MEVSLTEKLSRINEAIASLQRQIDELRSQLAQIESAAVDVDTPVMQLNELDPVEIALDDDMLSDIHVHAVPVSSVVVEVPEEDGHEADVAVPDISSPDDLPAAEDTSVEETPADDAPEADALAEADETVTAVTLIEDLPEANASEMEMFLSEDLPEDDAPMAVLTEDGELQAEDCAAVAEVADETADMIADETAVEITDETAAEEENPLAALFGFESAPAPVSVNDAGRKKVRKTVKESLENSFQWRTAVPGPQVKSIISAIPLNDRVQFVNGLFRGDALLYQKAISDLNEMHTLDEVESYVELNHSDWNLNSDIVYRFMMAVRRKIR